MRDKIKDWWEYIQNLLDVNGDVVMLVFTSAVIYKLVQQGLSPSDAAAYGTAVGCFAYSNKGKK